MEIVDQTWVTTDKVDQTWVGTSQGTTGDRDWPLKQFPRKPSKDILEALEKVQFDADDDDAADDADAEYEADHDDDADHIDDDDDAGGEPDT